jgi:hypothetical protein
LGTNLLQSSPTSPTKLLANRVLGAALAAFHGESPRRDTSSAILKGFG